MIISQLLFFANLSVIKCMAPSGYLCLCPNKKRRVWFDVHVESAAFTSKILFPFDEFVDLLHNQANRAMAYGFPL